MKSSGVRMCDEPVQNKLNNYDRQIEYKSHIKQLI